MIPVSDVLASNPAKARMIVQPPQKYVRVEEQLHFSGKIGPLNISSNSSSNSSKLSAIHIFPFRAPG
jgi:hypothetical protein